jgi:hypothetical protein
VPWQRWRGGEDENEHHFDHLLIVFGGVAGIEESVNADKSTALPGKYSRKLFDVWVNICSYQGSRTIRSEEAVFIALTRLSPFIAKNASPGTQSRGGGRRAPWRRRRTWSSAIRRYLMRTALRNKVNISSSASRDSFLRFYFIPFEDGMHPESIVHVAIGIANHLRTQAQLPNDAHRQREYCAPPQFPIFSICLMRLSPHRPKNVWYTSGMTRGLLAIPPSSSS